LVVDPAKLPATVFTYIHDIFPPTTLFSNTFDALIGRYYIGNAIKCDHIVCASEETQKDVVTRTSFSNTSEVVYQGIDMPDISRDRIVYDLCYVGSLMQRKDPEFLRKSIEQANDAGYRCVAVNFDPVDLPCETKSGLSQSELAELLASCRYYLHPSRLEGFGRSPVEAQSAGTIPIGRDIGINHEILGEEGCEWIAVDRPQDVVDLLDDDPSPSQQDAAQKNAAQYEWSETRARLKELLTENL
jgi:glycosyltransferase involved in cell wall biosynthesis